jgi:hypothetical protein
MIEALKASIAANEAKKAVELANGVALAERLVGGTTFDAKLAALDALIANQRSVSKTCDWCLGARKVWSLITEGYELCPDCNGNGKAA